VKVFAALYARLDASTATRHKLDALQDYLRTAPAADAAWALYFLAGGKPRQTVPTRVLREAAREAAGLPEWLFDESYAAVGDLAETIAHLVPEGSGNDDAGLAEWVEQRLLPLRGAEPDAVRQWLRQAWSQLDWNGRFVLCKLITGGLRVGVSRLLVVRALAEVAGLEPALVAQRMMGYTDAAIMPDAARYSALLVPPGAEPGEGAQPDGRPYPFFLAHPLAGAPQALGAPADWFAEWKWDGIRAQLVLRAGSVWLWSRGEELVTDRFPEVAAAAAALDGRLGDPAQAGLVLDGELLGWDAPAGRPLPFAALQRRIGRRSLGAAILREVPVVFVAYDVLEHGGIDQRGAPLAARRPLLEAVLGSAPAGALRLSPRVGGDPEDDWARLAALRAQAREHGVEGLMLKQLGAAYGVGRTRAEGGSWWKWKLDPFSVDAVLIYAQRGHGRRASLYTDYTFALWDRPAGGEVARALVPFAKAYSGLTDAEIREVDAVIRRSTVEKFGPVRSVVPELVFEIGFEGIARSTRHRSGVAVRFPRMLRRRPDKRPEEADCLGALQALLGVSGSGRVDPAGAPGGSGEGLPIGEGTGR
jgi:DNA ligase-1